MVPVQTKTSPTIFRGLFSSTSVPPGLHTAKYCSFFLPNYLEKRIKYTDFDLNT